MNDGVKLEADRVINTLAQLEKRIADRFPDSGLRDICNQLLGVVKKSQSTINWIDKPNIPLRIFTAVIILLGLGGLAYSIKYIDIQLANTTLGHIVGLFEAVFNDLVLIGAAIFFLISTENRIKRKRSLEALNELRVIAHVIDMHQLTKDPNVILNTEGNTEHSPKRNLTKYELQRYLDYCSEAMALIAKVGALYAQSLQDKTVISAVNEIENLCTGLSRKIWQKLIILNNVEPAL